MELIWSQPARRDLFGIAAHFRAIDPLIAADMLDRIEVEPLSLLAYPQMGSPTRRRGVRKWPVRGTPYILFYAIRGARLEVRRVIHHSMDWQRI